MSTENYLLNIQGTVQGQFRENVLCFQSAGLNTLDTVAAATDLVAAFIAHAEALWLACLPQSYFLDLYTAKRAFPKPSASFSTQYQVFSTLGTRGVSATSYNLCPSVFLVPPTGVKSGGKVFMPAVAQADVVNNAPIAAYTAAVGAFFAACLTGLAGSGTNWQLAVYSRKNTSAALVNTIAISPRLGFQGRRRKPVGSA